MKPATELKTMRGLRERIKALEDALRIANTTVRDFNNGWPAREMHEPPEDTIARCNKLLPED